mgnify:CR=1 FL=1
MIDLAKDGAHERCMIFLVILTQCLMFPFTFLCIKRIAAREWQWFNFWNVIDMLTQTLQVLCTVVFLIGTPPKYFDHMLAAQSVLLIAKIQFYARLVRSSFCLSVMHAVSERLWRWTVPCWIR